MAAPHFTIPPASMKKDALQSVSVHPDLAFAQPANISQPFLPFTSPSQNENALPDAAPLAIPEKYRAYIEKWVEVISDIMNGGWRKYLGHTIGGVLVRNIGDYIRVQLHYRGRGFSETEVHKKLAIMKDIKHDSGIPASQKRAQFSARILPKNRPGRSGHSFYDRPENQWMRDKLRDFYLNQAKHSQRRAHELLLNEIKKMKSPRGDGDNLKPPTLCQSQTCLKSIDLPTKILAREGEKPFDDKCAMYISRDPSTLRANDLWVTDQRQVDVRLRDGGEPLGRIWMVSFLDVATDKVLGYAFGPILSSDMVMRAATIPLALCGVPRAIHMDLGKEFICKAFNGTTRKFSGEALYREVQGLWTSLRVKIVKAIGRNPKSKTIERWQREVTEKFDKRFPGYCGSNTDERPEKLMAEERQHLEWLNAQPGVAVPRTPLVTMGQYIHAFMTWAENDWNAGARGRGKMRLGMTPNEAMNAKRPTEGFRFITLDELDRHTAEHRFVKVARGGQVNLTFFGQMAEYVAPELFPNQDKDVEVIVSRRTLRQVTVIYPVPGGTKSCVATLKPQLAWLPENRDELRAAMRCKAAVSRVIRQGVKASKVALQAANPVQLLEQQKALPSKEIIGMQKFFADSSQ
jgi:hypothetical protein